MILLLPLVFHLFVGLLDQTPTDYADASILVAASQTPLHAQDWRLLTHLPLQINPYTPLTYLMYGIGQAPHCLSLPNAHLVSLAFVSATSWLLYLCCRRLGASRTISIVAVAVVFLGSSCMESLLWSVRPDIIAVGFLSGALYCYIRHAQRPGPGRLGIWFTLTVMLVTAAFAAKVYPWATATVIGLSGLMRRRWAEVMVWALWLPSLIALGILWNYSTAGGAFTNIFASQSHLIVHGFLETEFRPMELRGIAVPEFALVLGLALYLLALARNRPFGVSAGSDGSPSTHIVLPFVAIYATLAAIVPIPLMMKWGANNYYLELAAASALLFAVAASYPGVNATGPLRATASRVAAALIVVFVITGVATRDSSIVLRKLGRVRVLMGKAAESDALPTSGPELKAIPVAATPRELTTRFNGQMVLTDTFAMIPVANAGASIAINDPSFYNIEFVSGNFGQNLATVLRRGILSGDIAYLVLAHPMDVWFNIDPWGQKRSRFSLYYFEPEIRSHFTFETVIETPAPIGLFYAYSTHLFVYRNTASAPGAK